MEARQKDRQLMNGFFYSRFPIFTLIRGLRISLAFGNHLSKTNDALSKIHDTHIHLLIMLQLWFFFSFFFFFCNSKRPILFYNSPILATYGVDLQQQKICWLIRLTA
jgi:hypothetical protein